MAALPVLNLDSRQAMQDSLLQHACQSIELTATMYNDARSKYGAVGEWLGGGDGLLALLSPIIYPQGSMALGTTVRPLIDAEFDLDLVCRLLGWLGMKPAEIYDAVYARLHANGMYRPILERKPRCLRLNYAGNFHLDIVPACADRSGWGAILVPDRKLECWCPSNPEEFGRLFFFACKLAPRSGLGALAKRAEVRPLPSPVPSEFKYPLQRIVQILKRVRDLFYNGDADMPASIVITTLAMQTYCGSESISEGLLGVLEGIQAQVIFAMGVLPVLNPTNREENFTANWSEQRYQKFKKYIVAARRCLDELSMVRGLDAIASPLGGLFGERYARKAIDSYTAEFKQAREDRVLRVAPRSAALTTSAASGLTIPRNSFYGRKY